MKKELEKTIERYCNSQTSLESYEAIYDFVEIIQKIPEFLDLVEKDRKRVGKAYLELAKSKPDYRKERLSKSQSEFLSQSHSAIHQMDTAFQYNELLSVYEHLKRNDLYINSITLFRLSKPNKPLSEVDKREYQEYLDRIYKKVLPFLGSEKSEERIKVKSYSKSEKTLYIGKYEILIARNKGNNNAHEIMTYIFVDNKDNLRDKFYYSEIAEKRFGEEYNSKGRYAHQKFSSACKRINLIVSEATENRVKNLLKPNYSKIGYVEVNPDYI